MGAATKDFLEVAEVMVLAVLAARPGPSSQLLGARKEAGEKEGGSPASKGPE